MHSIYVPPVPISSPLKGLSRKFSVARLSLGHLVLDYSAPVQLALTALTTSTPPPKQNYVRSQRLDTAKEKARWPAGFEVLTSEVILWQFGPTRQ